MQDAAPRPGRWARGDIYDSYVGRWSRLLALRFVSWLSVPHQAAWLDVGCGTGALAQAILDGADPKLITAIDSSEAYLQFARDRLKDERLSFEVGDGQRLPGPADQCDVSGSGLVLNFVPDPALMIAEMRRVTCRGGTVGLYVWDYAGKVQFMRHFWNAAAALNPKARDLDEGRRFPICDPDALRTLFANAALSGIEVAPIDIETHFRDFDDYWRPFEGGQGPAGEYALSLSAEARNELRERLRNSLPFAIDGSIPLVARAWAVKGTKD